MTLVDTNKWTGTCPAEGTLAEGSYTVSISGIDKAGNQTLDTATFCKQTVTIAEDETKEVRTDTTTLQIDTTGNVTDASISITQSLENPAENAESEIEAGVFLEIIASADLRDNLESIYIRVDYDEANIIARGIDESTLKLYLWDVSTGQWQVVPGSGVNTEEHYIYGTVTHLSKYGGFGSEVEEEEEEARRSSGGGGGGGRVALSGTIKSNDNLCWVTIAKDTECLTKYRTTLTRITIVHMDEPPDIPAFHEIIDLAYEFGPEGATFDPPITVTFTYDESLIPTGADKDNLFIAVWNATTGDWDKLDSFVNSADNTITAEISHFSAMTVLVSTRLAAFVASDLSISSAKVDIGDTVTISLQVTNTGDLTGNYTVILKIDGVDIATEEVTLSGGDSQTVTFTTVKNVAGTYTIEVNGLSGTFKVTLPPPIERPPAFTASNLSITPAEAEIDEVVAITVLVTNTGGLRGSYQVTLEIDGVVVDTELISLSDGTSVTVSFTTSRDTAGTYAVKVDGLSGAFKVTLPPPIERPPAFTASNLKILPTEAVVGEEVIISILVTNNSELEGSHTATLRINGVVEETKTVTVAAGGSKTISFTVSEDSPGVHEVKLDGQNGEYTVLPPPLAISWPLIGSVVAAVVVIGTTIIFLTIRRRHAQAS